MLGRLVWPAARLEELPQDEGRALAIVDQGTERQDDAVYLEGVQLDEVAARGLRAKIRCGGERIPTVEELADFIRGSVAWAGVQGDRGSPPRVSHG